VSRVTVRRAEPLSGVRLGVLLVSCFATCRYVYVLRVVLLWLVRERVRALVCLAGGPTDGCGARVLQSDVRPGWPVAGLRIVIVIVLVHDEPCVTSLLLG
jgi:hypothetical protein